MIEFRWLEQIGSVEEGIERANMLYWHIALHESDGKWIVSAGDSVILLTDSRETADSFLYGMALAYGILPQHIFEDLVGQVRHEVGINPSE